METKVNPMVSRLAEAFYASASKGDRVADVDEGGNLFFETKQAYGSVVVVIRIVLLVNSEIDSGDLVASDRLRDAKMFFDAEPMESRDPLDIEIYGNLDRYELRMKRASHADSAVYTVLEDGVPIIQYVMS